MGGIGRDTTEENDMNDKIEREARAGTLWGTRWIWLAGALLALCAANLTAKAESRATAGDWSRVAAEAVVEATWTTEHAPWQSQHPAAPFGQEAPTLQAQIPYGYGQICRLGRWWCNLPYPGPIGEPCWCGPTPYRPGFDGFTVRY